MTGHAEHHGSPCSHCGKPFNVGDSVVYSGGISISCIHWPKIDQVQTNEVQNILSTSAGREKTGTG